MKKLVLAAGGKEGTLLLAPLYAAFKKNGSYLPVAALAAGQDREPIGRELSGCFGLCDSFRTISLPSGSPAGTLAAAMSGMENLIVAEKPEIMLVCGSDDTALAAALAASRHGVPVVSVDAGLRNHERSDPREINRMLIDVLAGLHFVSEHSGEYNLINEGVPDEKVFFVGNLLIDSLAALMQSTSSRGGRGDLQLKRYALVIIDHSAFMTDGESAGKMLRLLKLISEKIPVLMPLVPEHGDFFKSGVPADPAVFKVINRPEESRLLALLRDSALLLTDIEELQAESTVMDVPCLTMSERTCRPSTIETGTNVLVGDDEGEIMGRIEAILHPADPGHRSVRSKIPEKWDGAAASRIVAVLDRVL